MGRKPKEETERKEDIVRGRVGEKTDLSFCPECPCAAMLTDCFAIINGRCTALKEKEGCIPCVFYKSTEQFFSDARKSYQRLKKKGRTDLIAKYIKTLSAMGMLDEEIEAAEKCGEEFELFKERDYKEQLGRAMDRGSFDEDLFDDELLSDTDPDGLDDPYEGDDAEDTDGEKIDYWDGGFL